MTNKDWDELIAKKDKTEQEELLIELRETIGTMNEILISYDEGNYSEEGVINDLRETVNEVVCKI